MDEKKIPQIFARLVFKYFSSHSCSIYQSHIIILFIHTILCHKKWSRYLGILDSYRTSIFCTGYEEYYVTNTVHKNSFLKYVVYGLL